MKKRLLSLTGFLLAFFLILIPSFGVHAEGESQTDFLKKLVDPGFTQYATTETDEGTWYLFKNEDETSFQLQLIDDEAGSLKKVYSQTQELDEDKALKVDDDGNPVFESKLVYPNVETVGADEAVAAVEESFSEDAAWRPLYSSEDLSVSPAPVYPILLIGAQYQESTLKLGDQNAEQVIFQYEEEQGEDIVTVYQVQTLSEDGTIWCLEQYRTGTVLGDASYHLSEMQDWTALESGESIADDSAEVDKLGLSADDSDTDNSDGQSSAVTLNPDINKEDDGKGIPIWLIILIIVLVLLAAAAIFAVAYLKAVKKAKHNKNKKKHKNHGAETEKITAGSNLSAVGLREMAQVHNIGARPSQQDNKGVITYPKGTLAVVADGMGGLTDSGNVSQKLVMTMMEDGARMSESGNIDTLRLYQMVAHANKEVNRLLGPDGLYKSGSTLLAVAVEKGGFQWVSVGDSRIYLYRSGQLLQINREHIHMLDLLNQAVNGDINFRDIMSDKQVKRVSSFIGMGRLKYVDGSIRPVPVQKGDRILLMTDGVFNTLSEQEICDVLSSKQGAEEAAQSLEEQVLLRKNPKQDNFTAVILDI